MGWAWRDGAPQRGEHRLQWAPLSWGQDQDPLKQVQVRGGDSRGGGGRDGHKDPTVTTVLALGTTTALPRDLPRTAHHLIEP